LNANAAALENGTTSGFFVKPVTSSADPDISSWKRLYYNTVTGEIAYLL